MSNRAASRYARALIQKADETQTREVVFGGMQSVYDTIQGSRELQLAIQSPIIKEEEKKKFLLEIFKNQGESTRSLIDVLVENKRTNLLPKVAESYIRLYEEAKGIQNATVITATPLTEELEKKVLSKIAELTKSDHINLKNEVDPGILGGFILRTGDIQYDASIVNQFRKLRKEFEKTH